jgi:serine/threonine protein phosphatase 1
MRYAIGDIHGCIRSLEALLEMIDPSKQDELFFLGDYIDRGPDSKAVLDLIFNLMQDKYKVYLLKGNHEELLLNSLDSNYDFELWTSNNGGNTTLNNFGVSHTREISDKYLQLIKEMPHYIKLKDYVLLHGGMNFKIDDPFEDLNSMLWERNELHEIDLKKTNNRPIVVGHTPVNIEKIEKSIHTKKIMLDGGCVYSNNMPELGKLCALELDTKELFYINNCENSLF